MQYNAVSGSVLIETSSTSMTQRFPLACVDNHSNMNTQRLPPHFQDPHTLWSWALRGRKYNIDRIFPGGKFVASCSLGNRRSKGPLLGIGEVGGATRVDTVQTMACLDIYRLLRQLQTVNTAADSCSCRWS